MNTAPRHVSPPPASKHPPAQRCPTAPQVPTGCARPPPASTCLPSLLMNFSVLPPSHSLMFISFPNPSWCMLEFSCNSWILEGLFTKEKLLLMFPMTNTGLSQISLELLLVFFQTSAPDLPSCLILPFSQSRFPKSIRQLCLFYLFLIYQNQLLWSPWGTDKWVSLLLGELHQIPLPSWYFTGIEFRLFTICFLVEHLFRIITKSISWWYSIPYCNPGRLPIHTSPWRHFTHFKLSRLLPSR